MTQKARMIGLSGGRRFTCGCCDWSKGKRGVKADETRQWCKDAEDEMYENELETGVPWTVADGA